MSRFFVKLGYLVNSSNKKLLTGTLPCLRADGIFTGFDCSGREPSASISSESASSLKVKSISLYVHKFLYITHSFIFYLVIQYKFVCAPRIDFIATYTILEPILAGLNVLKQNCGPIQSLLCGPTCVTIST